MADNKNNSPEAKRGFPWMQPLARHISSLKKMAWVMPVIILVFIDIFHAFNPEDWTLVNYTPKGLEGLIHRTVHDSHGNSIELWGVAVSWYSFSGILILFGVWLHGLMKELGKMFLLISKRVDKVNVGLNGVHDRLEHKSSKQEGDLEVVFNTLHRHSAGSRHLQESIRKVAKSFWELISTRAGIEDDHGVPKRKKSSVESRVFKLLEDANSVMSTGTFSITPWTDQEFDQYPRLQYSHVNHRVRATNIGSIQDENKFFGRNGVHLDEFVEMNAMAIKANQNNLNFKIERIYIFDKATAEDPKEKGKLVDAMTKMKNIQVDVRYLYHEDTLGRLNDPSPDAKAPDFAIFETYFGENLVKEMGEFYMENCVLENRVSYKLPSMLIIEADHAQDGFNWRQNSQKIRQYEVLFDRLWKMANIFTAGTDLVITQNLEPDKSPDNQQ